MLHFLCSRSYLFTFLLSSQFYWHVCLKSTAYFFDPPCIFAPPQNIFSRPEHADRRRLASSWQSNASEVTRVLRRKPAAITAHSCVCDGIYARCPATVISQRGLQHDLLNLGGRPRLGLWDVSFISFDVQKTSRTRQGGGVDETTFAATG